MNAALKTLSLLALFVLASSGGSVVAAEDEDEITLSQRHDVARVEAVVQSFARSSDLRLRILFALDGMDRSGPRPKRRETTSRDMLIDLARGSTDPLVLDLLSAYCRIAGAGQVPGLPCDRVEVARRGTEADTQNQLAWLTLAEAERDAGRPDEAHAAFERAAGASSWHDQYNDAARVVISALPDDLSSQERSLLLTRAIVDASDILPLPQLHALGEFCKEFTLHVPCGRIVETMVRDSQLLLTLNIAVPFASRARLPPETVMQYQRQVDACRYAISRLTGLTPDEEDPDHLPDVNRQRASLLEVGERKTVERYLAANHIDESEAARLWVSSLSPEARRSHDRWSRSP